MNGDSTQINCEIGVRLFEFLVKLYVSGKVDDRIRVAAFAVIANGCGLNYLRQSKLSTLGKIKLSWFEKTRFY